MTVSNTPRAWSVEEIETRHGRISVLSGCRVEIYDPDREAFGYDPEYLLPGDFNPGQWDKLSVEEKYISLNADRGRLSRKIDALQQRNGELTVGLIACALTALSFLYLALFY